MDNENTSDDDTTYGCLVGDRLEFLYSNGRFYNGVVLAVQDQEITVRADCTIGTVGITPGQVRRVLNRWCEMRVGVGERASSSAPTPTFRI